MDNVQVVQSPNYKTVKELLLDEQKLVTYVTVAKDLCIHVNESKNLLKRVLQDIRKESNIQLNVCYIVSGICDDNSAQTIVCSEAQLDEKKQTFKAVLFEHIYSISQGKNGVDSAALVSLNKFEDFPLCPGLIKSSFCSRRTVEEFELLKEKSLEKNGFAIDAKPTKTIKKENSSEKMTNGHTDIIDKIKVEVVSPKKELANGSSNKTNIKPKSKGLAGFLTKSQSIPSVKSKKPEEEFEKQTSKTEQKDSKNIANFFTKSNSAPNTKTNNANSNAQKPATAVKKDESDSMDVDITEDTSEKSIKVELDASSNSSKKNKTLKQIKKNAKNDKKRKRVLQVSDSDSDEGNDPFAEDNTKEPESEDEIPPTPATSTVKITSGILNPKKRRKIVDKTYTDEDGYILTRKEEVYESCSDEEAESVKSDSNIVKKEKENFKETNKIKTEISPKGAKATKNNKKKISPPQKGKQATLMNFFKRV